MHHVTLVTDFGFSWPDHPKDLNALPIAAESIIAVKSWTAASLGNISALSRGQKSYEDGETVSYLYAVLIQGFQTVVYKTRMLYSGPSGN